MLVNKSLKLLPEGMEMVGNDVIRIVPSGRRSWMSAVEPGVHVVLGGILTASWLILVMGIIFPVVSWIMMGRSSSRMTVVGAGLVGGGKEGGDGEIFGVGDVEFVERPGMIPSGWRWPLSSVVNLRTLSPRPLLP